MKKVKQHHVKTQVMSKVTFVTYANMMSELKQKSARWSIPMKKFISVCIFVGLQEDEETIKTAITKMEERGGEI